MKNGTVVASFLAFIAFAVASAAISVDDGQMRALQAGRDLPLTEEFIVACNFALTNPPATDDALVTQRDFTTFLEGWCISQGACEPGFQTNFYNLPIRVQLAFVRPSCEPPNLRCNPVMNATTGEFGYEWTPSTEVNTTITIEGICGSLYPLLGPLNPVTNGKFLFVAIRKQTT